MLIPATSNFYTSMTRSAATHTTAISSTSLPSGAPATATTTAVKSAREEFLDYAKMTPAQKIRATILSNLKITEEELARMDQESRNKIEDQIKEMIKSLVTDHERGASQPGALADLKA